MSTKIKNAVLTVNGIEYKIDFDTKIFGYNPFYDPEIEEEEEEEEATMAKKEQSTHCKWCDKELTTWIRYADDYCGQKCYDMAEYANTTFETRVCVGCNKPFRTNKNNKWNLCGKGFCKNK